MTRQQLQACNKNELTAMARQRGLAGYQRLPKQELIRALLRSAREAKPRGTGAAPQTVQPAPQPSAARKTSQNGLATRGSCRGTAAGPIATPAYPETPPRELRTDHDKTRIMVMVRDPYWLHCCWELSRHALQRAEAALEGDWHGAVPMLRLMEVSGQDTSGCSEAIVRSIPIHGGCNNWYLEVTQPPRTYRVDLGYLSQRGRFFVLARSNVVRTPKAGSTEAMDHHWSDVDEQKANQIYALSGGFDPQARNLELKGFLEERLGRALGGPVRPHLGAGTLLGKPRPFAFQLDADLVLFGHTEPRANLLIQGEPVKVQPDGSFSLRLRLPDSRQTLPIVAHSADGLFERTVVLTLERHTKHLEPRVHQLDHD